MNATISSKWPSLPAWDNVLRRFWRRWEKAVNAPWPGNPAAVAQGEDRPELPVAVNPSAAGCPLQGARISLPLSAILQSLPAEFRTRASDQSLAGIQVSLPLAEILPQLGAGKVQITLGKLRGAAPEGQVAITHSSADETLIDLPLADVLDRLNPLHLIPPVESGAPGNIPPPSPRANAPETPPRFTPPLPELPASPKLPPTRQEMLARRKEAENPTAPARIALLYA